MGNKAHSNAKNPEELFHSSTIKQNGVTISLKQPDSASKNTTVVHPKPKIPRALSLDEDGDDSSNEDDVPNFNKFESLATAKKQLNKHLQRAMKLTPASNIVDDISDVFIYKRQLAKGSSCCVLLVQHKQNNKLYALKEMAAKSKWSPHLYMTEKKVLQMLSDHPNVMTYFDCYIDDQCLYIASEYCSGGTLLDRIIKLKVFTEEIAAKYISTILKAVDYMHDRNICHRDLKLNNIVFDKNGDDGIIKLIDFGDALQIEDEAENNEFIGTIHYFPPELIRTKRRKGWQIKKGDVYCIGVMAYVLLTGCFPFHSDIRDSKQRKKAIQDAIVEGKITWPKHVKLSNDCKDFILSLLDQNIEKRSTAKQALSHKWLANASKDDLGDDLKFYQTNFHHSNKLQQILIQAMFTEMSKEEKKLVIDNLKKYKKKKQKQMVLPQLDTLNKERSAVSEQEFVEFMISYHVDENKARKSTRNLFRQVPSIARFSTTNFLEGDEFDVFLDEIADELIAADDDEKNNLFGNMEPIKMNKIQRKKPMIMKAKTVGSVSLGIVDEEKENEYAKDKKGRSQSVHSVVFLNPSITIKTKDDGKLFIEITATPSMDESENEMYESTPGGIGNDSLSYPLISDSSLSPSPEPMERQESLFKTEMNLVKPTITVQQFKDLLAKGPKVHNIGEVIKDLDPKNTGIIDLKLITNYSRDIQMH